MVTLTQVMFFFLLTLLNSLTPTKASLIQDVCSHTTTPDSCTTILRSDSRASSAANLYDLGKIVIRMEVENMDRTTSLIEGLRKNREYPSPVVEALGKCENRSSLVLKNCVSATGHLGANQFGEAEKDFRTMADNINYCKLAMKGFPIDELSKETDNAFRTSYIGAVVMSMLGKPSPPTSKA